MQIEMLGGPAATEDLQDLTGLLVECVNGGAAIGFLAPLAPAEARVYWRAMVAEAKAGQRVILVAREKVDGPIVGCAQLGLESRPNCGHRAEVQKILVRPDRRRRGIATRLMAAVEEAARDRRVRLLFLDTSEGPGGAKRFYEVFGYTYVGGIPGYAVDPNGTPVQNAIYYKTLAPGAGLP